MKIISKGKILSISSGSAYQIAVEHGFEGTEEEWLESLKGKSAYEIAVENGFEGSEQDWLDSIQNGSGGSGLFENFEAGKDWIGVSLPPSATWRSVTYGDGKFVTVAYGSNKSAYSLDGITWTESTLPSSANWYFVTYGDGKFVTVAYSSNKSAYSEDGITWTESTLPSSAGWHRVTYGDGKFVAIAYDSNKSAYSLDGVTWTQRTLPSSTSWYSVTYGDGKFVAISGSTVAAYSEDGITWTQTTLPSSADWRSVTYGDGKFVVVSITNKSAYSEDGITWTESTLPSSANWYFVTYGDGKFVTVVNNSDIAAYSEDGITWTQTMLPLSADWRSVTYGDGKFVAVARDFSIAALSFTGKVPSSGTSYIAGFGITIEGDEISVNHPNIPLTRAEYDALSEEEKNNGAIYIITDEEIPGKDYQAGTGIDIENDTISANHPNIPLTRAEYDALSEEEKNNGAIYIITDEEIPGKDYQAGSGIEIEDDIISAKSTMVSLTLEEYEALSEEEKNRDDIYYCVEGETENEFRTPDSSMEIYDDQERVIGTWFGKLLYRRIFSTTTPSTNLNGENIGLFTIDDGIELVDIDSFMIYRNGLSALKLPYYDLTNKSFDVIYKADNEIRLHSNGTVHTSSLLRVTLKYTKTTDEAGEGL